MRPTSAPIEMLEEQLDWYKSENAQYPYLHYADETENELKIRMNNFPDEPLFTLLKEGKAIISFDDWPSKWKIL